MSQQDLLREVVGALERAGVRYMVTGSVVSSLLGEPRSSHDVDFVVELSESHIFALAHELAEPDLLFDTSAALDAARRRSVFNVLDTRSGDKVDFWILTDEPFDRCRFERRRTIRALGLDLVVTSPEDTILMKLRWSRLSGDSDRQYRDALGVFEVQGGDLDDRYLAQWAAELGVLDLYERLCGDAGEER